MCYIEYFDDIRDLLTDFYKSMDETLLNLNLRILEIFHCEFILEFDNETLNLLKEILNSNEFSIEVTEIIKNLLIYSLKFPPNKIFNQ
jgi:hypothetical protein